MPDVHPIKHNAMTLAVVERARAEGREVGVCREVNTRAFSLYSRVGEPVVLCRSDGRIDSYFSIWNVTHEGREALGFTVKDAPTFVRNYVVVVDYAGSLTKHDA